ncbi:MAG: MarR family transcriptional regulator [Candidatus Omnitrophica bacterium]|nr:MarR family transcriptional regulator [Candidatus Omnitrophota bacterium]
MNSELFAKRMLELLPYFVRSVARHEHNDLTKGELSLPQFWAMDYLYRTGEDKMSNLAHYLNISPASTTGLIDRLIARKLVVRKNDAEDRRIVRIDLTPKGKSIICSIREQKIRTLTKIFGRVSPGEREHFLNILAQAVKITNSLPGGT